MTDRNGRLIFNYAVMNSGKSLHLLQVNYNYQTNSRKTLLLKSAFDTRSEQHSKIESRLGVGCDSILVHQNDNPYTIVGKYIHDNDTHVDVVLIDEVQFLTKQQVYELSDIADRLGIMVIAYGLKVDAFGNLFEGSKALLELADKINELKQICHCGAKATMHLRYSGGQVVREGDIIQVGAEESYKSVCRKHWKEEFFKVDNNNVGE